MSWGHDEYLYHVVKDYLPEPALYMIRYHSFYAAHREGAYDHLMNDHDRADVPVGAGLQPLRPLFEERRSARAAALRPYYEDLVAKYLPPVLRW